MRRASPATVQGPEPGPKATTTYVTSTMISRSGEATARQSARATEMHRHAAHPQVSKWEGPALEQGDAPQRERKHRRSLRAAKHDQEWARRHERAATEGQPDQLEAHQHEQHGVEDLARSAPRKRSRLGPCRFRHRQRRDRARRSRDPTLPPRGAPTCDRAFPAGHLAAEHERQREQELGLVNDRMLRSI